MRRSLTVAALLWLAAPRFADCQTAKDAAELQALLAEFLAGASRNDAAVHDRFWADSLVYTRSTGRRIGKADILKDVRIQQFGDAAVVAFRLVGTTTAPGFTERDEFLNTGTFVRRDGRWQAVAWQATRVPPTEADARLQVAAFDKAFHAALLAADVKTLDSLLDDGFAWTHSDGHKLSGPELVSELESGKLRYTKLETSGVTTWVRDGTAVVRGDSLRQRSANPATPGKGDPEPLAIFYTLTLVADRGAWKAVAMHSGRR